MSDRTLRAALHVHSRWSYDGAWSLRAIARLFGAIGVDVVMVTEHDDGFDSPRFAAFQRDCAAASTARVTLVPGIEYSCPRNDVHILTWGLDVFIGAHRPTSDTLADVAAAGGAAVFAHPRRRDVWRLYDDAWTPLLHGMEIWNRKTDGLAPGAEALDLAARTALPPTVGVDFHRLKHLYPLDHLVSCSSKADPGAATVAAVRAGALQPRAFGWRLTGPDGRVSPDLLSPHRSAEALRRRLRRRDGGHIRQ